MSDEARKNCRTQGRFSDGKAQKSRDKKHKNSYVTKDSPETQTSKRNSEGKSASSALTEEDISPLKYTENSDYSFTGLERLEKPEEIHDRGERVLSKTTNGESRIFFEPQFLADDKSDEYFDQLYHTINWDTRNIIIHGVEYPQPRLVAWFGPFPYSYSGVILEAAEMPDVVLEIKKEVESCLARNDLEATFNSVLINLYRDGKDSVAWHSDDEIMLGLSPTIASVSLGETRKFELRSKMRNYDDQSPTNRTAKYFVNLTHGSLIVMTGCMQEDWQHRIPKEYHDKDARINLTFRRVFPLEKAPVKEINLETESRQSCGQNSSRKTLKNEYKLDDEHFPSLQKDVGSAKSNVIRDKYDNPKNFSPNLKRGVTAEESWDTEICNVENNVEGAITHKNTYSVFDKKDENCKLKNNFINEKPSEKKQNMEAKSNSVNDKTATKKLWSDEYDSSVNDFQENNTVEKTSRVRCHKSAIDSSSSEIQGNKYYNRTDNRKMYDRETSLPDKTVYRNIVTQEEYSYINPTEGNNLDHKEPSNTSVKGRSWVNSSEESNLDITVNETQNVDAETFTNVYRNVAQENDVGNGKLRNTRHVEDNSRIQSSGKSNFDVKRPATKMALNADAKEFIPNNMHFNEISQYSEYRLEDLVSVHVDSLKGKELQDHAQYLKKRICERFKEVTRFERYELEFLLDITDGSQTDKNQRLISKRICRKVQNTLIVDHHSPNSSAPIDRSFRNRSNENQGYQGNHYSDKGRRYPHQIRYPKSNRGRF